MTKLMIAALAALSLTAYAQEPEAAPAPQTPNAPANVAKPSAEAVKQTWDFFYKGKGAGVVLADAKLCSEIGKSGDEKSECTKEVLPTEVKAGSSVMVWQAYLVPQGDAIDNLTLTVKQGDTVRETKDIQVKGEAIRMRTWTSVRIPKPGKWTLVLARGNETLKTFDVDAKK